MAARARLDTRPASEMNSSRTYLSCFNKSLPLALDLSLPDLMKFRWSGEPWLVAAAC